jgi:cell wall-associated NlpC family hydrolase
MSAAIKAALVAVCGFVLLLPLALIGLGVGAQNVADQTCIPPMPTTTPTPSSPAPASSTGPSPSGSPSPSPSPVCDDGDGLPDDGTGGIPSGFVLPSNAQQATAVAFALAQLGKPYVFGATGPNSYDCSGLVIKAWAAAGVTIPRTTEYQVHTGVAVTSVAAMQPGDLIFIPGSDGTMAHPGHVAMYIGRDGSGRQWLVQAPHTGTVVHTTLVSSWASEIAAIRRPVDRSSVGT